jgi:hypothetical protein
MCWLTSGLKIPVLVGDIEERERRITSTVHVDPLGCVHIESVPGQELPTMRCHKMYRFCDEVKHGLRDEIVEIDPYPTWLDAFATKRDLVAYLLRMLLIDSQQRVAIGPCTRASASRLDTKEVVEYCNDEVVVEILSAMFDNE